MSQHHSRAEKTEGHLRKPGRPGSFSGGGKGGDSGGGSSPAPAFSVSSAPPPSLAPHTLPVNRSFKKSDNGQGGQSRGCTVSSNIDAARRTGHDAAYSTVLSSGSSVLPATVNVKPENPPNNQKISRTVPKPVSAAKPPSAAGSSVQVKGDTSGYFLQFGTINPGIVSGMQIPARTTSAPPNLDEQILDQARHDSFRAVPTLPIPPSVPKPQLQQKQENQQPKKDVEGVGKGDNGETHPPIQAKRDLHAPVSSAPHPNATTMRSSVLPSGGMTMKQQKHENQQPKKDVEGVGKVYNGKTHPPIQAKRDLHAPVSSAPHTNATTMRSSVLPSSGMTMPVPLQHPQIHFQFNGSNLPMPSQSSVPSSLHMTMALPVGNVTQVPHQMFVPNIQSHPLQPQAIMHQGHGLGFTPQLGHQMTPQLGGMGIGITHQFPQQQPGHFGTQRKAVKITHPETHEELKLDKRTDSHTDAGTSGQRHLQNISSQCQSFPAFSPSQIKYHKAPYNPSQMFFPPSSLHLTNTQMPTGAQAVRYGYPVSQNGQAASFMNSSSSLNSALGGRTGLPPPLHGLGGAVHSEGSSFSTSSSATVQATIKQPGIHISDKTGKSSIRISLPATRPEHPKLLTSLEDVSSVPHQKIDKIDLESSVIIQKPNSELLGIVPSFAIDKTLCTVFSTASNQINKTETSPSLHSATVGDSLSVMVGNDGSKMEAKQRLESIMDRQTMSSKTEPRLPQQHQDMIRAQNDNNTSDDCTHIPSATMTDSPTSAIRLISADLECRNSKSVLKTDVMRTSGPPVFHSENTDQGYNHAEVAETPSSVLDGCMIVEFGQKHENFVAAQERGGEESDNALLGSNSSRESAVSTTGSLQEMPEAVNHGVKGQTPEKNIGAELDTSEGINSEVERTRVLSMPSTSSSDHKDYAVGIFNQVPFTIPIEAKPLSVDSAKIICELTCSKEVDAHEFVSVPPKLISISPVFSEIEQNVKGEVGLSGFSRVVSVSMEKPDPIKAKTNIKKKTREILTKADTTGASDLYNAYKTLEGKDDATVSTSGTDSRCSSAESKNDMSQDCNKVVPSVEEVGRVKAEVQDWEESADASIPKLRTSDNDVEEQNQFDQENQSSGKKKYTRDFLLAFSQQCNDLPEGFENGSDIAGVLMCTPTDRESHFSHGRLMDRSPGASRVDKRINGISDDDKRARASNAFHMDLSHGATAMNSRLGQGVNNGVLRNPRVQPPNHFTSGILSGPMQSLTSQGGMMARSNLDIDRWQLASGIQRGLFHPPQGSMQMMHKSSNRYEVRKSSDEEEQKQRQLKAILNKLTPQNFDKLFSQVKDVEIDNTLTLSGVISQIFDKALMEPTFCEMYADFCLHLARELPDFLENDEKITFRRLLLTKCQEEFERGEREQAEANKAGEEGEIHQNEEEREEKRIRARRRMLGNIRLIGELYKKKMLTERIMHECIMKLLGYYQNPDEEDIESLCKLMSTIGVMIDHYKAKDFMDAYFDRMAKLSINEKLSSRVRFMLKDAIDLRKNKWQQRMKVEGPKKIEDVHKDAAQERQAQTTRLARGPLVSSRRGPPATFGQRGTTIPNFPSSQANPSIRGFPTQARGIGNQDVRHEDRQLYESHVMSAPLPHRPTDDGSITLGPQGGLAKGMSGRGRGLIPNAPSVEKSSRVGGPHRLVSGSNASIPPSDQMASTSREDSSQKYTSDGLSGGSNDQISFQVRNSHFGVRDSHAAGHGIDRSSVSTTSGERPVSSGGKERESSEAKAFSEETLREKSISTIREFYSAMDEEEVVSCIKELNAPYFYPSMVSLWVTDSFERKTFERNILAELLVNLTNARHTLISQSQLIAGFESVLSSLEEAVNDAPKAPEYLGHIFGKVVVENVVPLQEIASLIREGGEEPGSLVEFGLASEVLFGILEFIKTEKGDSLLNKICIGSNLQLEDFKPPNPTPKSKKLDAFL